MKKLELSFEHAKKIFEFLNTDSSVGFAKITTELQS